MKRRDEAYGPRSRVVTPVGLGGIRPRGWLQRQLALQAENITGPLPQIWKDLGPNSGWLGGSGESWERGPYYCDGLVPLAWQLGSRKLTRRATAWMEGALESQRSDGWFGPSSNNDWWPRMVMLKALIQWAEASGNRLVVPFLQRYFRFQRQHLPTRPLDAWGRLRGSENILAIYWTYLRTGDAELMKTADLIRSQMTDWSTLFERFPFRQPIAELFRAAFGHRNPAVEDIGVIERRIEFYHESHGVNMAMGLKAPLVFWLLDGDIRHVRAFYRGLADLLRYHGTAGGVFSGDEHLAGLSPLQGTETCTVAEFLYSLEQAAFITGDSALWDTIERAAFAALPASMSDDLKFHQYFQQDNQVRCSSSPRPWYNGKEDSNLFGLEPTFGCCTANLHQAWPKFLSSSWGTTADGGVVCFSPVPCEVDIPLPNDERFQARVLSDYPFGEELSLLMTAPSTGSLALRVRVPGWCAEPEIRINGRRTEIEMQQLPASLATEGTSRSRYLLLSGPFERGDRLQIRFAMAPRERHFIDGSSSVEYGPLVLALPLEERWKRLPGGDVPGYPDWEVTPAADGLAYCLEPDGPRGAVQGGPRRDGDRSTGRRRFPFSSTAPPIVVSVAARPVEGWNESDETAPYPPERCLRLSEEKRVERIRLVPYGSARLRISRFPVIGSRRRPGADRAREEPK